MPDWHKFHMCSLDRKTLRQERASHKGVILVEFSIVLLLILFIAVGVINLGSFLAQMNQLSSSARSGARAAQKFSTGGAVACNVLVSIAITEAHNDLHINGFGPKARWSFVEGRSEVISSGSDSAVFPPIQAIRLTAEAINEDNCLLCIGNFLSRILPRIDSVFILGKSCV